MGGRGKTRIAFAYNEKSTDAFILKFVFCSFARRCNVFPHFDKNDRRLIVMEK